MLYGNYSVMLSLGPQAPVLGRRILSCPLLHAPGRSGREVSSPGSASCSPPLSFICAPPSSIPRRSTTRAIRILYPRGARHITGSNSTREGKAAKWLRLDASAAAIHAISNDTGTAGFDDKQVINVPRWRSTLFADVALPHARGLHVMPGWSYTGRKEATRDNSVSVPPIISSTWGRATRSAASKGRMTLRLYADNITR